MKLPMQLTIGNRRQREMIFYRVLMVTALATVYLVAYGWPF